MSALAEDPAPAPQRLARARAAQRRARWGRISQAARGGVSFWSRSLRLRVLVLTLSTSILVIAVLGLVLQQQITDRLLESKRDAAIAELENALGVTQSQLSNADPEETSLQSQLLNVVNVLGRPVDTGAAQGGKAGVFEPVVATLRGVSVTAGLWSDVPAELRSKVSEGTLAWQYTSIIREGQQGAALVVGGPAITGTDSFGVFLIFPLSGEQRTIQVIQRTLLVAGAALVAAMTLIAVVVASQVVRPVRRAAAVAERFAAGALEERMPVKGAAELTTMARSFNGMAEAIRAQIRQLEEFGRLQRRFTSDVSHELRTPVTTVRMAADLLHAERKQFPAHLGRATELLVDELDRFETLLADLLEISRHDAGMAELNAEPTDVRGHVESCVTAVHALADRVGVSISVEVPDDPVIAEVDARRFERILRNLLGNAIDHADGGRVEVEVADGPESIAIAVTDYGVGLRPGEAGLVFNRFWRADPSRQRQTGGTGLGLAISLEDARLHGGWLQASGTPGLGARFRLTLPKVSGTLVTGSPLPLRSPAHREGRDDHLDPHDDADEHIIDPVAVRTEGARDRDPRAGIGR
ncbi:MAG: MtrAB system histidine kinase MtrB [Nakamurella sp.]